MNGLGTGCLSEQTICMVINEGGRDDNEISIDHARHAENQLKYAIKLYIYIYTRIILYIKLHVVTKKRR